MGYYIMPDELRDIFNERQRQDELKEAGRFLHTCADVEMLQTDRLAVLVEEVGEVARAVLNFNGLVDDKKTNAAGDLRKELIQVAAVCVAWLEGLRKPNVY